MLNLDKNNNVSIDKCNYLWYTLSKYNNIKLGAYNLVAYVYLINVRRSLMCKASTFIICENVQTVIEKTDKNEIIQKPQIINPIDTISMFSFPGYFTFAIFGNLINIDDECENATIHIEIIDPDNEIRFKSRELPIPSFTTSNSSLKFSYDIRNFTFNKAGIYKVKLFLNDKELSEVKFTVERSE